MPSCQDIREYLPFYADDEIPAEVRPTVEAHLALGVPEGGGLLPQAPQRPPRLQTLAVESCALTCCLERSGSGMESI